MNVRITIDQDTAAWAQVEAARAGQSLSAWIVAQLGRIKSASDFETDVVAVIATPRIPMSNGGRTFNRDEIYD